jgi:hypothetical protein
MNGENGILAVPLFCVLAPKALVLPPNAVVPEVLEPKPPVAGAAPPPNMPDPPVPNVDLVPEPNVLLEVPPNPVLEEAPPNPPKVLLFDVAVVVPNKPPPPLDVVAPNEDLFAPNGEDVVPDPKPVDLSDFWKPRGSASVDVLPPNPVLVLLVAPPPNKPPELAFDDEPKPVLPEPKALFPPAVAPNPPNVLPLVLFAPKPPPPNPPPNDMLTSRDEVWSQG